MNKKNHILFGFFLSFIFVLIFGFFKWDIFYFSLKNTIIIFLLIAFFSLLPDVDQKNSTIIWFFLGLGLIGLIGGIILTLMNYQSLNGLAIIFFSTLFLIITFSFPRMFGHRGIIHTFWVGLLFVIPIWFIFHDWGFCILAYISWYSHLLGDGFLLKFK